MNAQFSGAATQSMDWVDFGEALVRMRRAHGLSQGELAARLQVAASTVSRLERGRMAPSLGLTARLDHALSLHSNQAAWFRALAAHSRLLHAARAELHQWDGASRLVAWLAAQRSSISERKEQTPT